MAIINVPSSISSGTAPTEAQFDTMRTYLLNFFNGGVMDQDNLSTGGITYAKLSKAPDDATIKFASSHGTLKYNSTDDKFEIKNSEGDIIFGVHGAATYGLRLDDAGNMYIQGTLSTNTSVGDQSVNTQWLMTRYRKPRLEYSTSDIISIEENSVIASETLIMMRDRLCEVYDRTCSLAVAANGYLAAHTGTAVSGLKVGVTRTDNRWYYIYAVRVQGGTQSAAGSYCILVADPTSPESSNIVTLNAAYGTGEWLYVGVIRNGYNDGEAADNIILPFVYGENGYCRFTTVSDTGEGAGVTMAEAKTVSNLEYTLYYANDVGASIPIVATRATFFGYREANGTEFHYRSSTGENNIIVTGCYHTSLLSTLEACLQMEVPLIEGYKLVVTNGSVETWCRITLAGFQDQFA